MPNIQPDGVVELYSHVDIDLKAGIQINFETADEQSEYFTRHVVASHVDCSYIRKSRVLRLEISTSIVSQCNYIAFRNPSFENKVFFAAITSWEYVNNTTTDITYDVIDWYQTDRFTATCRDCKIEREHLSEADYQKAVQNPWRTDIPDLLTAEPLEVSPDLEDRYPDDVGEAGFANTDAPWRLLFPNTTFDVTTSTGTVQTRNTLTICISPFNPRNLDTEAEVAAQKWATIKNSVDYWGGVPASSISDTDTTAIFNQWSNGFVRPFALGGINIVQGREQEAVTRLKDVIDLLTFNDLSSTILGVYVLPTWVYLALNQQNDSMYNKLYLNMVMKPMPNIDPKLNTYPFRYIRVMTPNGTVKEYDISKFYEDKDDGHHCEFKVFGDGHGVPTMALIPYRYKNASGGDVGPVLNPGVNYNYDERIEYSGFPQAGFAIDGFLTYLSAQYQQNIVNNGSVASRMNSMSSVASTASSLIGGGISGLMSGGPVGMISSALSTASSLFQGGAKVADTIGVAAESRMRGDATIEDVSDIVSGSNNSFMYGYARGAFAASNYICGQGSGYLQYLLQKVGFIVEIATLRSSVLAAYTKYFNMYGYNSLRIGKPRVWGGSPHYANVDGKLSTYVKTAGMSVEASTQESAAFIEALFNNGCRFLKGSSLL